VKETKHTIPIKIRFATVVEYSKNYVLKSDIEWDYFKRNLDTDKKAGIMRSDAAHFAADVQRLLRGGDNIKEIVDLSYSEISDDEKEWEIESIINKKEIEGEIEYLVKWKIDGSESWEPLHGLLDKSSALIEEYEKRNS